MVMLRKLPEGTLYLIPSKRETIYLFPSERLGDLIKNRLKDMGKNQTWLAHELMVTDSTVSRYIHGKTIPKKSRQKELFEILNVQYWPLENLGYLIERKLEWMGRRQRWLAQKLRVTDSTVSRYIHDDVIPREDLQPKLFEVLGVQYQTLDDLLE